MKYLRFTDELFLYDFFHGVKAIKIKIFNNNNMITYNFHSAQS